MKIVIDIDEDTYRYMQSRCKYQNKGDKGLSKFEEAGVAIKNGIPLPKGHGRLIDADKMALLSDLFCYTKYTGIDETPYEDATKALEFAPTIIEADGGDAE